MRNTKVLCLRKKYSSLQLLTIVSTILLRNPELSFQKQLNLNKLVEDSFLMYCKVHIVIIYILHTLYNIYTYILLH